MHTHLIYCIWYISSTAVVILFLLGSQPRLVSNQVVSQRVGFHFPAPNLGDVVQQKT